MNRETKTKWSFYGASKFVVMLAAAVMFAIACMPIDSSVAQEKRGLGGNDNALITGINAGWYYNWSLARNSSIAHAEYVPMFWSGGNVNTGNIQNIIDNSSSQYVLGFNEPEREDQSNMTVAWALNRWAQLQVLRDNGFKLVSPAPSDTQDGRAWLDEFMAGVEADPNLEVDEIAFHWYGSVNPNNPTSSANSFLNKVAQYHNNYGRPVWITEFAGLDFANNFDSATMQQANRIFLETVVAGLENRDYVTRYAWWNHNNDSRLLTTNTDLPTETGEAWIDTIVDPGQVFNINGQSQGDDVFYLRGGELTNTGNSAPQAIRYIDAPEGSSIINGSSDYGLLASSPGYLRIRNGATLRKQGSNTITLPGSPVFNDGTLMIQSGTLQLEGETELTGQGTLRVDSNGTLATSGDDVALNSQNITLNQGLLHVKDGLATISNELQVLNSGLVRTDGNLVVSGSTEGTGGIWATGPGTLFLSSDGLHTAGALVSEGSLIVANSQVSATGPGNVFVDGTGTLGGFGKVDGDITASAGTVAPGVTETSNGSTSVPVFNEGVVVNAIDFDFTGIQDDAPLTQTSTLAAGLELVSGLDFGPGLQPRNASNAGNEFNVSGFTTVNNWSSAAANDDYLTFTVAPVEGLAVKLEDVSVELRRNGTGAARLYRIFTSIDGFHVWNVGLTPLTFVLDEDDTNKTTLTRAYPGNEIVSEPIEVRIYGWFANSGSGNTRFTNVSVDASFFSDPNGIPFDPTGILELGGNYTQTVSATMKIDLAGSQPGQFDQLQVAGNVALGGTLDVSTIDGFAPTEGQTFDIITGNSISGTFSNVVAPSGMNFDVIYSGSTVSLQVAGSGLLGDVNLDGEVTFLDIGPFIAVLSSATYQFEADVDQNGVVNFLDIGPFIDVLANQ